MGCSYCRGGKSPGSPGVNFRVEVSTENIRGTYGMDFPGPGLEVIGFQWLPSGKLT